MRLLSVFNHGTGPDQAAVVSRADGIGLVSLELAGGQADLVQLEFIPLEDGPSAHDLGELGRQKHLARTPVNTVMPLGSYQLLLVEMPKVPDNEVKAAVRWQVKDLIDFHIDDAVIDVFDAPPSGAGGVQDQVYVVVTPSSRINELAAPLQEAGLTLHAIDIPELALRNLAARLPEQDEGIAMLYLEATRGIIALCRKGVLYLARTIEMGFEALNEAGPDTRGGILSGIALEIQRSMDYYDRYFQQAPINHLYVAPTEVQVPGLVRDLQANLGMDCREIEPGMIFPDAEVTPAVWPQTFLAAGAALREEAKSL